MTTVPEITLNNGVRIPQLGFGVWQVGNSEAVTAVGTALEAGYRSIDTAALYGNEEGVGQAVRDSGIPRDEVFVTSKLANSDHGYDSTLRAFDATMDRLKLDRLDLYLIHWVQPRRNQYVETWKAFERLYAEGRVRAIGVSNFHESHLNRLFEETGIVPAVNQVELHPALVQGPLRRFHAEHGIATEAWSPLGQGKLLQDPVVAAVARAHGVSPAQVILRWHIQLGNVVIPKSVTPERIRANFDVFGFELTEQEMAEVSGLDSGRRFGSNPDDMN